MHQRGWNIPVGGSYLHVHRFTQAVHHQGGLLVPHRVEVFVNSFAPKNLLTSKFELDVGVAAAWDRNNQKGTSQISKKREERADGEAGGGSAPPLSRTARLCPLFSSTSSLYIPELLA